MPALKRDDLFLIVKFHIEIFEHALQLKTLLYKHVFVKNGDQIPQTVDYLTAIGIIALVGDRESILLDYYRIREMESELRIQSLAKESLK